MKAKIPDLPSSNDKYWEGAETQRSTPTRIPVCESHFKDWTKHNGYLDNHDGTVTCKFCPWGCRLPGYMRVYMEKIVDLRKL